MDYLTNYKYILMYLLVLLWGDGIVKGRGVKTLTFFHFSFVFIITTIFINYLFLTLL